MRTPTTEEIAQIKRLAQDEETSDTYYEDMIPIVLEHINDNITEPFEDDYTALPGTVKLFIAQTVGYFAQAAFGVKSEKMGSVSFSYDYSKLPASITGLLSKYGYGQDDGTVTFYAAW